MSSLAWIGLGVVVYAVAFLFAAAPFMLSSMMSRREEREGRAEAQRKREDDKVRWWMQGEPEEKIAAALERLNAARAPWLKAKGRRS